MCPLRVSDGGVVEQRVYPKYTVVLEKYLLRPGEEARRRFTLAHEAGHIIASQLDPHANACFHRDIDAERLYTAEELRQRMSLSEWQANMLAGCLLMPRFIVKNALTQYNNGRKLPVYGTSVFRPREKEILGQMTRRLGVSRTAVTIRLRDLGAFQYLNGYAKESALMIAQKYGISPQAARKRRSKFEEFTKLSLVQVSF